MELYLKKEFLQFTGNFKERGARYALLMLEEEKRKRGVIAASSGNYAQAISYHGLQLGIPITVVMPITAPVMKITRCRKLKASVIIQGRDMSETKRIALRLAHTNGLTHINRYDHLDVLAGQGSIGLEALEQVPDVDAIVIPCGGGGMIAGTSLAVKSLKPNVQIIAMVQEASIALAILRLVEVEKCIVEGAGATTLASVMEGQLDYLKGKKVVLVLSGGNIDTTVLGRCLERGLAADGRLVKVMVCVSDRPGGLSELIKFIASLGVTIKDIVHERAWVIHDVFSVDVICVCETRDMAHTTELRETLKKTYKKVFLDFLSE